MAYSQLIRLSLGARGISSRMSEIVVISWCYHKSFISVVMFTPVLFDIDRGEIGTSLMCT